MSNPLEMLEIIDENDNVIGLETREKIHKEGKAEGFEAWKIDDIHHLSETDKNKFIGLILREDMLNLFDKAKETLLK